MFSSLTDEVRQAIAALVGMPVRFGAARPRLAITLCLVLLLASSWCVSRLRVELDVLSLIPEDNQAVGLFRSTLRDFGSMDYLLLAVELDESSGVTASGFGEPAIEHGAALDFVDALGRELAATDGIEWIQYRRDALEGLVAEIAPHSLLLLDPDALQEVRRTVSPDGLTRAANVFAQKIRSPIGVARPQLLAQDPLGIFTLVVDRVAAFAPDSGVGLEGDGPFLTDREGRLALLIAKPSAPAADIGASRELIAAVRDVVEEVRKLTGSSLPVLVGGGAAIAVADSRQIVRDTLLGAGSALAGVSFLFALAFRRRAAFLYAVVPLGIALVVTAACGWLMFGRLNAATSIFAALLIGLGVDFVILIYGRAMEERGEGGLERLVEILASKTAPGLGVAALTTAAAMATLATAEFDGLAELGLLTAVGIVVCLLVVLVSVPAMFCLLETGPRAHAVPSPAGIRGFGLERVAEWSQRQPRAALLVVGTVTMILLPLAPRLQYSSDALSIRSVQNPGAIAQERISDVFGLRFTPYLVRVDSKDADETLRVAAVLEEQLLGLVGPSSGIARIDGVARALPSVAQQQDVIEELASWDLDQRDLRLRMEDALRAAGVRPEAVPGVETTIQALTLPKPLLPGTGIAPSLGAFIERYLWVPSEGGATEALSALVYVYTEPGRWRREPPPAVVDIVERLNGEWAGVDVGLTGPVVVSAVLKDLVLRDAGRAGALALTLVVLLLFVNLGFREGAIAVVPLLVGGAWFVGSLGLLQVELNFLNLFVFPMLIGIAVDYGVHLVHRAGESDDASATLAASQTPRVIVLGAATTMIGFGGLVLSTFPGLESMGRVAIVGTLSVASVALLVIPAMCAPRRDLDSGGGRLVTAEEGADATE